MELLDYERNEEGTDNLTELRKLNYDFWIRHHRPEKEINPEIKELIYSMIHKSSSSMEENECEEIEQIEKSLDILEDIQCEVLVINGANDVSDFLAIGSRIHDKVSSSRLRISPEATHLPNLENGDLVKQYITEFLTM